MNTKSKPNMTRAQVKKYARKEITARLTELYNSDQLYQKLTALTFKTYTAGGFSGELKMSQIYAIVNIYQDGEISYKTRIGMENYGRRVAFEPAEKYYSVTVTTAISRMLDEIERDIMDA